MMRTSEHELTGSDRQHASVVAQAQRIKLLAEQFDFLLHQQARRLESALLQAGDVPHDPKTLKQMMTEFERVRAQWEEQRDKEEERIQHDSARLAEAWLKLESEQRRLLAERQALQVSGGSVALPSSIAAACNGNTGNAAVIPAIPQPRAPQPWNENHQSGSKELSMLEFQQLKREMQRHGRTQK